MALALVPLMVLYISGNSKRNMRKGGLSYFAYLIVALVVSAILFGASSATLDNPFETDMAEDSERCV